MQRRTYRLWHHWLSIIGGLFLLLYTFTGVWMLLPRYFDWPPTPVQVQGTPRVDMAQVALSPAEAFARAMALQGPSAVLIRMTLETQGPTTVYAVNTTLGMVRINAANGEPAASLTSAEAEALVRSSYGLGDVGLERELVEKSSWRYWGDAGLPAYVFHQPNTPSVVYAVGTLEGKVSARSNSLRLHQLITRSHTLWPVRILTGSAGAHDATLLLTGLVSLLLIASGLLIVLPIPRIRRGGSGPAGD